MTVQAERRGFYRAVNRLLETMKKAGVEQTCKLCDGAGLLIDHTVCEPCGGWGDTVEHLVRKMRHDDHDKVTEILPNLTEHFSPGDTASARQLAIATVTLEGLEPEVLIAWLLANASVVVENAPQVLVNEDVIEWAMRLAENIEDAKRGCGVLLPLTQAGEA